MKTDIDTSGKVVDRYDQEVLGRQNKRKTEKGKVIPTWRDKGSRGN